jgi:hypothetical protein
MIATQALCRCESVADQLTAMVLDALGAVSLLLPTTGADSRLALAASAWCHDFCRHTPGAVLLNLASFGADQVEVWIERDAQTYGAAPALLAIADADVVICDGLDAACLAAPDALPRFLAACARRRSLTVAPVIASDLMGHRALRRLTVAADALIAPDPVARQRSALLGAALMHRTTIAKES